MNADAVISSTSSSMNGYNLFSYCFNNPVNMTDSAGSWPKLIRNIANWVNDNIIQPIKGLITSGFTVNYDVPLYNQGNTNLCWAYSQTMVEDFNSGITRNAEGANARAREIAEEKHGVDNWNRGSKPNNLTKIDNNSMVSLFFALKNQGPLYASYGLYQDGERVEGHAIIVTGVDLINRRVYTNNPWGISGDQSYNEFLTIFVGETRDGWRLDNCYYFNW